jgi:hypothetical protein
MPLKRIIGKAIVSTVKGKKAGEATSAAMKKKAAAAKAAKANARGLKAAQGPSMAPKGYVPDTVGRGMVKKMMDDVYVNRDGKLFYNATSAGGSVTPRYLTAKEVLKYVSSMRSTRQVPNFKGGIPEASNIVSKSGKKANTPKLIKKAAKKKAK